MANIKQTALLESFAGMSKEEQALILISLEKYDTGEMKGRDMKVTTKEFEAKLKELEQVK